jgi:hypothetical protein
MRKIVLCATLVAAAALAAVASYSAPAGQAKSHRFRCTDRNPSLLFVIYEQSGELDSGRLLVEEMSVGVLEGEWASADIIKAGLRGNTPNGVAFHLDRAARKVFVVTPSTPPERAEVCKAEYEYP